MNARRVLLLWRFRSVGAISQRTLIAPTTIACKFMLDKENVKADLISEWDTITKEGSFEKISKKDPVSFQMSIAQYMKRENIHRRGHVEFINAAITNMDKFGVHKDIEVYKHLFHVFPTDKMRVRNHWQAFARHFPKQQECGISILSEMQFHGVCPDDEIGHIIDSIFGKNSEVFKKFLRMLYWMPKFKGANPWHIPFNLPDDGIELAKMALNRMKGDPAAKVTIYHSSDHGQPFLDDTFIASSLCPNQISLLNSLPPDTAIYVEGSFSVWLREKQLSYFVLRTGISPKVKAYNDYLDEKLTNSEDWFQTSLVDEKWASLPQRPSVHEQEDQTVLCMCITGTSSKDSLISWIKCLQMDVPNLCDIPVVFTLQSPERNLMVETKKL